MHALRARVRGFGNCVRRERTGAVQCRKWLARLMDNVVRVARPHRRPDRGRIARYRSPPHAQQLLLARQSLSQRCFNLPQILLALVSSDDSPLFIDEKAQRQPKYAAESLCKFCITHDNRI